MQFYLNSIQNKLGYEQITPTLIYEHNMGALFMVTADQPTKRTKHMDTKSSPVRLD